MTIREYTEYREEEIRRLYSAVGWTAYTEDMETLRQAKQASQQVIADDPQLQKEEHAELKDAVVRLFQKNGAAALN